MSERGLAVIEADIKAIPFTLPPHEYKRRLDLLQTEWIAVNAALFGLQVAAADAQLDLALAQLMEER